LLFLIHIHLSNGTNCQRSWNIHRFTMTLEVGL
jgi:hypothetical protein